MKRALIATNEDNRILEIVANEQQQFPVSPPLVWVDVANGVTPAYTWDGTKAVPPPTQPLADVRAEVAARINSGRREEMRSGVVFEGNRYDTDPTSLANLTAAVTFIKAAPDAGLTPPATVSWRDADNVDHDLTYVQLILLAEAMFVHVQTAHATARALKDSLKGKQTAATIRAVKWPR